MAHYTTGQFSISNYNPGIIYVPTLITGSGTATLNTSTGRFTLSAPDSRFSVIAKYGVGAPESDARFMERKAPVQVDNSYFVETSPFQCYGCGAPEGFAAPCCAPGPCGCGTFHQAGAFPYTGFWACCAGGYIQPSFYWQNFGPSYTWSGSDYTNGQGEWYKLV